MIRIAIDTKNAAFEHNPGEEVARLLRSLADRLEAAGHVGIRGWQIPLMDLNGNTVGTAREGR